jgi:hypothetical protein
MLRPSLGPVQPSLKWLPVAIFSPLHHMMVLMQEVPGSGLHDSYCSHMVLLCSSAFSGKCQDGTLIIVPFDTR